MGYIWETRNLVKNFTLSGGLFRPKQTVHALQGVSLHQEEGETLGIVGESGCGKSTFGYTLMGIHQATSGSIYMNKWDSTWPMASVMLMNYPVDNAKELALQGLLLCSLNALFLMNLFLH